MKAVVVIPSKPPTTGVEISHVTKRRTLIPVVVQHAFQPRDDGLQSRLLRKGESKHACIVCKDGRKLDIGNAGNF